MGAQERFVLPNHEPTDGLPVLRRETFSRDLPTPITLAFYDLGTMKHAPARRWVLVVVSTSRGEWVRTVNEIPAADTEITDLTLVWYLGELVNPTGTLVNFWPEEDLGQRALYDPVFAHTLCDTVATDLVDRL